MPLDIVARRLLEAQETDAGLRSALRAAYPGRHDVVDALWWRVHPLTAAPSGRVDPAAELAGLQAAVYSRSGPDGPPAGSERRLAELTARLRQDDADLDTVLLAFRDGAGAALDADRAGAGAGSAGAAGAAGDARANRAAGAGSDSGTDARGAAVGVADAAQAAGRGPRARRGPAFRRTVLLLAAGAVAGAAIGAVIAAVAAGGTAAGPAASASPGLVRLYDQPPIPDQTTIDLGPEFRRDSIHAMFVERETSSFVYVARSGEDLYCVILRTQGQLGASACVGLAELAGRGLTLTATVPVNPFTLGKDSVQPAGALADVTIRVGTDGTVTSEAAPHPTS